MTGPLVSFPFTFTVRSAVNPLKSFCHRAVFSKARRSNSRGLWVVSDCGFFLFSLMLFHRVVSFVT